MWVNVWGRESSRTSGERRAPKRWFPPTVSLFPTWVRGGSSTLSQPIGASPCPWRLKVLDGHCFVFLLEDLGAGLMEPAWLHKPHPGPFFMHLSALGDDKCPLVWRGQALVPGFSFSVPFPCPSPGLHAHHPPSFGFLAATRGFTNSPSCFCQTLRGGPAPSPSAPRIPRQ